VHNLDDVAAVLQKGKQNRSTFATNMNEHSSRSHLVLSLYVKAEDLIKGNMQSDMHSKGDSHVCLQIGQIRWLGWGMGRSATHDLANGFACPAKICV
jgi:hypothetical protein